MIAKNRITTITYLAQLKSITNVRAAEKFLARLTLFSSIIVAISGCSTPQVPRQWLEDAVNSTYKPLTQPIVVMADTQFHESRGTASRFWSLAGDEFVPVTIRTGQQVIGAGDLLLAALNSAKDSPLILHLGDAIDISCETEWDHFNRVMKASGKGRPSAKTWLFAPGNHDGFLVGNFFPLLKDRYNDGYWSRVCNVGRHNVNNKVVHDKIAKPELIKRYLTLLGIDPTTEIPPATRTQCLSITLCFAYNIDSEGWKSWVVQLVQLPRAANAGRTLYALLLDTSDYATQPKVSVFGMKAGVQGSISVAQLTAAENLLKGIPLDARVIIVGHHSVKDWNFSKWPENRQESLQTLLHNPRVLPVVITAHTHEGGWYEHQLGAKTLRELNIGSLSDAPLHYRTLRFAEDETNNLMVSSDRILLGHFAGPNCNDFAPAEINSGYAVSDQRSESDRNADSPGLFKWLATLRNASVRFLLFWKAKHDELRPQLLAYADVVEKSMPHDEKFRYQPFGEEFVTLSGSAAVAERLRHLGSCRHETKCSVQEKGHLLYQLDEYYWNPMTADSVRTEGHRLRYCGALVNAQASASGSAVVWEALRRSAPTQRTIKIISNP